MTGAARDSRTRGVVGIGRLGYAMLRRLSHLIRNPEPAHDLAWRLLTRPAGLFQSRGDTWEDRYPRLFQFVRDELEDRPDLRLLSYGCSTGEEVFTLARYFPGAHITGLDINPRRIRICQDRLRKRGGDARLAFTVAASPVTERTAAYDAIFCMAVFRHGDLKAGPAPRCDRLIHFADFERITADLARCLRRGGLLVIRHSNFRFRDTGAAAQFELALRTARVRPDPRTPLYGSDDRLVRTTTADQEVVFRKLTADPRC